MAHTQLSTYQDATRLLADARLALITDDTETRFALDDAWDNAVNFVLRQAAWRFALKTTVLTGSGSALLGYAYHFAYPVDLVRTHSIFASGTTDRPEYPVDLRERLGGYEANLASTQIRYISSSYADPAVGAWTEHFAQCVAAYLAFSVAERVTGERGAAGRMSELFSSLLPQAIALDAEPESRWLRYQRNGEMVIGARDLGRRASWRFALVDGVVTTSLGVPAGGYLYSFPLPSDHLRTHALFVATTGATGTTGKPRPIDIREQNGFWSTNVISFTARYVGAAALRDPSKWPEPFYTALLAFLEAGMPHEAPAHGQQQQVPEWQQAIALAIDAAAEPDDEWLSFQLDGSFAAVSRDMRERAFWRFAMWSGVTITPPLYTGTFGAGYTRRIALGSDFLRLRSAYLLTANGEPRPVDVRLQDGFWYTDAASFHIDYLTDNRGLDPTAWPDLYLRAVHAELVARHAPADRREAAEKLADMAFDEAADSEADARDKWLPFQLDGSFANAVPAVMSRGNWWWALVEQTYNAEADQLTTTPAGGFPYRYALPSDWFKTHALFVPWDGWDCPINIRETAADWSTDAANFVARYVSTAALDPVLWPMPVVDAVYAYLIWRAAPQQGAREKQAEFDRLMDEARADWSRPDDDWLSFQRDGSFQRVVKQELERGRWRFAIRTLTLTDTTDPIPASLSDGAAVGSYAYRFIQPTDLLRTVRVYLERGVSPYLSRYDIDFIDEADAFHTNQTPVIVRYVSRLGLDSTKWPAHFRDAVLAYLQYTEARRDPAKVNIAAAKLKFYKDAIREAERLDDARDRPRIIRPGQFVRARRGYSYSVSDRGPILLGDASLSIDGGLTNESGDFLTNESGDILTP